MNADLKHYSVPVGTKASECRGSTCGAKIYWIRENGRPIPVDCGHCDQCCEPQDSAPLLGELESTKGLGVHHSMVCSCRHEFAGGSVK